MNYQKKGLLMFICLLSIAGVINSQEERYAMERKDMVRHQIMARGIHDTATLNAIGKVPRHFFVPDNMKGKAYRDSPLPIGFGQTISQPYIVAFMTAALELDENDRVLEIGTGSGYQAAVLSEIVDSVFTVEIVEELANTIEKKLKDFGYSNIRVKSGDGFYGWKEYAPYDKIIVTAAAEEIPPLLIEQLNEGGRMIIPVGPEFGVQYLVLLEKKYGKIEKRKVLSVRFVPFTRE